jgi:uncharacterized protein YecE (DUF72 family)
MSVRKSKKQGSDEKSRVLFDLEMPASRDVKQESMKEGIGETLVESARATAVGSNIEWKAGAELAEQGILAGTSAFTAAGWEGTFYPAGMKAAEYLRFYATRFRTVEVDSTFYGTPKPERVRAWYEKTPADFVFAVKVPQVITHEKALVDCEVEMDDFLQTMALLHEKLGPVLLQFGYFGPSEIKNGTQFLARLEPFLKRVTGVVGPLGRTPRFVVEIRNKAWLDEPLLSLLREYQVALALTDHGWMPRPWEVKKQLDLITADFAYVRWLGDRKGIEEITTRWDKTVLDRRNDLLHWVEKFRELRRRNLQVYAYANNHYAGNGPRTVKLFWEMYEGAKGESIT